MEEFDIEGYLLNLELEDAKTDPHHSLIQLPDWDNDELININNIEGELNDR